MRMMIHGETDPLSTTLARAGRVFGDSLERDAVITGREREDCCLLRSSPTRKLSLVIIKQEEEEGIHPLGEHPVLYLQVFITVRSLSRNSTVAPIDLLLYLVDTHRHPPTQANGRTDRPGRRGFACFRLVGWLEAAAAAG
jgi:hypothetical protein